MSRKSKKKFTPEQLRLVMGAANQNKPSPEIPSFEFFERLAKQEEISQAHPLFSELDIIENTFTDDKYDLRNLTTKISIDPRISSFPPFLSFTNEREEVRIIEGKKTKTGMIKDVPRCKHLLAVETCWLCNKKSSI